MNVIPLTLLSEILVILTNYFLGVSRFINVLSVLTIFTLSVGITSLGMFLGCRYPRFDTANPIQIAMGFGGVVYMVLAMAYSGAVIFFEAGPVYVLLSNQWRGRDLEAGWQAGIMGGLVMVFIFQGFFIFMMTRLGLRAIQSGMGDR